MLNKYTSKRVTEVKQTIRRKFKVFSFWPKSENKTRRENHGKIKPQSNPIKPLLLISNLNTNRYFLLSIF